MMNIIEFIFRLIWRHIVLAAKIVFGLVCAFLFCYLALEGSAAYSGKMPVGVDGAQEGKFFRFLNVATSPLQYMVEGFVTVMGFIAILFIALSENAQAWVKANPETAICIGVGIYLIWLYFTVKALLFDIFGPPWVARVRPATITDSYAPAGTVPMTLEEGGFFFDDRRVDDPKAFADASEALAKEVATLNQILTA